MYALLQLDSIVDFDVNSYFFYVAFVHFFISVFCCIISAMFKNYLLWGYALLNMICFVFCILMAGDNYYSTVRPIFYDGVFSVVNISIAYELALIFKGILPSVMYFLRNKRANDYSVMCSVKN